MKVRELAHSRAGDKGNTSNINVIAYNKECYKILKRELTEDIVEEKMADLIEGPVKRYDLSKIQAFNFVIENALAGGVTTSLRMDSHGKSLSHAMLDIDIDVSKKSTDQK